jgi:hypothetical protein
VPPAALADAVRVNVAVLPVKELVGVYVIPAGMLPKLQVTVLTSNPV